METGKIQGLNSLISVRGGFRLFSVKLDLDDFEADDWMESPKKAGDGF
jgi:hypothetical protein